jgi:hypothetical protein
LAAASDPADRFSIQNDFHALGIAHVKQRPVGEFDFRTSSFENFLLNSFFPSDVAISQVGSTTLIWACRIEL